MRPPRAVELVLFARALTACPALKRRRRAQQIIAETEAAQDYFRHHQACHPALGMAA